jgi:hypothetical protein
MTCTFCNKSIAFCRCDDIDARLREIAYNQNSRVLFQWCRSCDRHSARCDCIRPLFFIIHAGNDVATGGQR